MSQILRSCIRFASGHQLAANVTPAMRQRTIMTSARRFNNKEGDAPVAKARPEPLVDGASLRTAYRPNKLEQRMLVWTKKYKSLEEVPTQVT